MVVLELQQVEIDHCMLCGGIWLDRGELELLSGASMPANSQRKCCEQKRRCPACGKRMEKAKYAAGSDIVVDRCARGHGVWFDKGELETLLQMNHTQQSDQVACLLREMFRYTISQKKEGSI